MNETFIQAILARKAFSKKVRMIYGYTNQPNISVSCKMNVSWSYDGSDWSASGGSTYSAISDSEGYFEIILPDNLVINNFTFDSTKGASQNNVDYIDSLNLSYIGNTNNVNTLQYAFSNLKAVKTISGFNQFKHSPIKTMECCFRSCEHITELNLTGLNTNNIIIDTSVSGGSRYGFPNCFYNCAALEHLVLPKIPSTCYMGGGTFYGCEKLTDMTCSDEIANDLPVVTQKKENDVWVIEGGAPLTLQSMRDILSHLSTTSGHECKFWDSAWYYATNDSQCQSLVSAAEGNGWSFVPTYPVYWFDDCTTYDKFHTSTTGDYLVGTEKSREENGCSYMVGKTYMIVNDNSTPKPHDYAEYRFGSNMNLTNASTLDIIVKTFMWTYDPGTGSSNRVGLKRTGINTRTLVTTQVTTVNDNFPLYIRWVDSNGNTGSWTKLVDLQTTQYSQSSKTTTDISHTISLPSSGFSQNSVAGFDIMYMSTSDSVKERIKGCWWYSILIK